jgi:phosphoglycolate phosphatase
LRYKNILFDFDGTLTDSKEGITKSVQYALRKFGISVDNLDKLDKFIGPPLIDSFMEYCNFSREDAEAAVEFYRDRFSKKGIHEHKAYEGIRDLLIKLKESRFKLFVATSKPTIYAASILKDLKLFSYFHAVVGCELNGIRNKKGEVINYVIDQYNLKNKKDIVMVGDRSHDVIGAKENEIDVIGVTYGYGSGEELKGAGATYLAESTEDIFSIVNGRD